MDLIKQTLNMKLESFSKVYNENNVEDPTLLKATFIILEIDEQSGNKEVITKEEALKMSNTMALKPLTCQYTPTTNYLIPDDHFGTHGKTKDRFRKNGEEFITTNSFAIGVAKEGCYLDTVEKKGVEVEVLKCDFYLWVTRYLNICSLMEDIFNSGATLYSSCEYVYKKSDVEVINGIKYPKNLIFEGHCLLGNRDDGSIVEPAFEVSHMTSFNEKWTSVVNELVEINNEKEEEEMAFKKEDWITVVNELSHGQIQDKFYTALSKVMTADEFYGVWISDYDIYDDYFVYHKYVENECKYFKVNYTKTETDVTIDFEGRTEVKWTDLWVAVSESEKVTNSLNAEIKTLNETISTIEGEKVSLNEKYVQATEKVTVLNEKVSELQPIVDEFNKVKNEKALNEKIEYYKDKFTSLNAIEKFKTDEVQKLIEKSLNEADAKEKLSDMILELVPSFNEGQHNNHISSDAIKSFNSIIDGIDVPEDKESNSDFDSMFTI